MNAILRVEGERRWSYATAASLVLTAWLALAFWSLSPYAAVARPCPNGGDRRVRQPSGWRYSRWAGH